MSSKVNITKSEPSFIPTPSPFAIPSRVNVPLANRIGVPLANRIGVPSANRIGVPSASLKDATPSSRADVPLANRIDVPQNKTVIKVNTTTRVNKTDILKNPEPTPTPKIIISNSQTIYFIEICIIMIIVYIIYRYCIKKPMKKNPRYEELPIYTPPSSPQNRNNNETYYAFHHNSPSVYRRTKSSQSLT